MSIGEARVADESGARKPISLTRPLIVLKVRSGREQKSGIRSDTTVALVGLLKAASLVVSLLCIGHYTTTSHI